MSIKTLLGAALLLALTLPVACSDDDENAQPAPPTFPTTGGSGGSSAGASGGGSDAGSGGSDAGSGGSSAGSGGDGGAAGTAGTAGTGGAAGAGGNCQGENGCYACPPTTLEHYLNRCTGAQCVPFDDAARLPLYNGGNLPPVP
jgi:hypothetical protein